MIIISNEVYANYRRLFIKDKKKVFKGMNLWKEVTRFIGPIYVPTGNQFYLDDYGFEKVTKSKK